MSSSIERAIARLPINKEILDRTDSTELFAKARSSKVETPRVLQQKEKTQEEISEIRLPLEFDLDSLARDGYLTPDTMQGGLAEEYRILKHILFPKTIQSTLESAEYRNLIAITSAVMGEGKTFTAFNLATSLSVELNSTVLLIDGDFIGRSLTQMMGLNKEAGLIELLSDNSVELTDIIYSTNIPRLKMIPAGRPHQHNTELMRSERMQALAQELSTYYDDRITLFDTPPLLANSLAVAITELVGQILVVIEEGRTPHKLITQALSLLDEQKSVGIVLNKCVVKQDSYYY